MRDLIAAHPRADKKIARDAASYNNEAVFYRDFANGVVSLADNLFLLPFVLPTRLK